MMVQSGRDYFQLDSMVLRKLEYEEYTKLGWFDCGDDEINEFFHTDALPHKQELMAESYCFEIETRPLALVSIQNDSIHFTEEEFKDRIKFGHNINLPFAKRYNSIPAIKLGRLGVHKDFAKKGVGTNLLECCKRMYVNDNRTGCRLILVDSHIDTIKFYEKNKFILFPKQNIEKDTDDDTVIMYCDLKPYL
jgi:hypothetical protein